MKVNYLITLSIILFLSMSSAVAGVAKIEWINPDDYRDVRPANETKKRFQERTFKSLDKFFNKLATKLPKDYQFIIQVTDIDLAGDVEFTRTQPIRIVRQLFYPRMNFSYQLLDNNGKEVMADKVTLKDMNFLNHINSRSGNESLGYEKTMFEKWFKKTMATHLVAKTPTQDLQ